MYTIKTYKRSRHIRITIRSDGTVLITKPPYVRKDIALEFARSKEAWIQEQLKERERTTHSDIHIHSHSHFDAYKKEALELIGVKIERWNRNYNFPFGIVKVKQMTTRWGSCSVHKNLNFNYKLMFLPDNLIDYVVVHELCHLKELNHSKNFWSLVGETFPNHKELRKELSKIK